VANRFQMCSRAMVLVGGSKIASFSGASIEEQVAEELYELTLMGLLNDYRWRFASDYIELNRLSELPAIKWGAQYQIPADVTIVYGAYEDGYPLNFDRVRDKILCDSMPESQVVLHCGFRPDEAEFPPYFETVLVFRLAAMFAVPIAEDPQKAAFYESAALRKFGAAKSIEAQGRTPQKMPVGGLRRYHGGGA
jgi:hypothetical protein